MTLLEITILILERNVMNVNEPNFLHIKCEGRLRLWVPGQSRMFLKITRSSTITTATTTETAETLAANQAFTHGKWT